MSSIEKPHSDSAQSGSGVQGEGDYESARKYDKDTKEFLGSHDPAELAKRAAPRSKEEADELKRAEDVGLSHRATSTESNSKPGANSGSTKQ